MYRVWAQIYCQDRHWNTDQKEDETLDEQRRDGGTNSTLRTKEQRKHLTLNELDDDERSPEARITFFVFRNFWNRST